MDDKLSIKLMIDGTPYPLNIRRSDEEQYRKAARQIDNKLNKYRSVFQEASPIQYWAMAALELSFENLSMKDRNDTAPFTEKLAELTKELEGYFAPPSGSETV
jgi:cell division protein ZapA